VPDLIVNSEPIPELSKTSLVILDGAIDAKTVVTFQNQLNTIREEDVSRIVLDMEQVKYVNSTGLGYLINLADSLQPDGGGIALVKVQPKVRVVFDMLGLNAFFNIYGSREEAIDSFRSGGGGGVVDVVGSSDVEAEPEVIPVATATVEAPTSAPPAGEMSPALVQPTTKTHAAPDVPAGGASLTCGTCRVTLVVPEKGNFKCPRCATVFTYIGNGKANFLPRRRTPPVQLQIPVTEECGQGLARFVEVFGQGSGFDAATAKSVGDAVASAVNTIRDQAYGGNGNSVLHAILIANESELEIRLSDHGAVVNGDSFAQVESLMDRFEHSENKGGGNLLTMAKKAGG
jgi:anti-anti-sigma factor